MKRASTAPAHRPTRAPPQRRPGAASRRPPSPCCRWSSRHRPRSAARAPDHGQQTHRTDSPCAVRPCARTAVRYAAAGTAPARPASAAGYTALRPGCSRAGAGVACAAAPAPAACTTTAAVRAASAARAGVRRRDPDGTCSGPATGRPAAGTAGSHAWRPVAAPLRGRCRRRSTLCPATAARSAGRPGRPRAVRPGRHRKDRVHRGPGHRRPGNGAVAAHEVRPARDGPGRRRQTCASA